MMGLGDALTTVLGAGIVVLSLWDIFLTVLHIDRDGALASRLHRLIWAAAVLLARRAPRMRRSVLALAGPAMMVLSFTLWIGLFMLGFALVVWPHMNESFRSEDAIQTLTFADAIYFSGITGTVLGYGDITPTTAPFQLIAVVESGLGFALLTGIVTYLLSVVSGVADRNILATRLHSEVHNGSGTDWMIRCLESETLGDVRLRLENLTAAMQHVQEKMHQFPILDLYYRSLDPRRDPEPMIQTLVETAITAQLLAQQTPARRLQPVSEGFAEGITGLMQIMAAQFLPGPVREQFTRGHPEHEDQVRVEQIQAHLKQSLSGYFSDDERPDSADRRTEVQPIIRLAFRARIFLRELDRLTGWKMDSPPRSL